MLLNLKYFLRIYYRFSVLWFIKYNEFSSIIYKYLYLIIDIHVIIRLVILLFICFITFLTSVFELLLQIIIFLNLFCIVINIIVQYNILICRQDCINDARKTSVKICRYWVESTAQTLCGLRCRTGNMANRAATCLSILQKSLVIKTFIIFVLFELFWY